MNVNIYNSYLDELNADRDKLQALTTALVNKFTKAENDTPPTIEETYNDIVAGCKTDYVRLSALNNAVKYKLDTATDQATKELYAREWLELDDLADNLTAWGKNYYLNATE